MKPSEKLAKHIYAECVRLIPNDLRPKYSRPEIWRKQIAIYVLKELCPSLPLGRAWQVFHQNAGHTNAAFAMKKVERALDKSELLSHLVGAITTDVTFDLWDTILQIRAATNVNVRQKSIEQVNTIARSIDIRRPLPERLTDIQTFVKMTRATTTPGKHLLYKIAAMAILAAEAA